MTKDLRINSKVFDGKTRAPNRAMLRAVGFTDEDFKKPMVGIASTWSEVTPCNVYIKELAESAKSGARDAGGAQMIFITITVSDGMLMRADCLRYSLPSRHVFTVCIELVVGVESFDAVVTVGGCDKNIPDCLIAINRSEVPAVFVYGGTIRTGKLDGEDIYLVSVFE